MTPVTPQQAAQLVQEAAEAAPNTLVLVLGDHGPPFVRGKTSCYEAGVKVPLIAVWPGVFKSGQRTAALVSAVDILPTILDAAGLASPPVALQGRSLRATLDPAQQRTYLATEFNYHGALVFFPRRTIRDGRYKLIHNLRAGQVKAFSAIDGDMALAMARTGRFAGTSIGQAFERHENPPEFELYDLQSVPWEFNNLADAHDHASTRARLQSALREWQRETSDPLLTPEGWAKIAKWEKPAPRSSPPP